MKTRIQAHKFRFLPLLAAMLMLLPLTACHDDDDDLPRVDFDLAISGATYADGVIYVVQGDTLEIESITVVNLEQGKNAAITAATYYWDGYCLGSTVQPPYGFEIITDEQTPVGRHSLEITSPLLAEGKALATAVLVYPVQVVADEADLPGTGTTTFRGNAALNTGK
ncbi:MAG: hypothetical protein J6C67_02960 [Muribaculaceae bacterium]|nr:hypothetical protein [Muribaculaceae bacterium]